MEQISDLSVVVLNAIGNVHWVEVGLLSLVAAGLERPNITESNRKESLKLLKSMNDLSKVITQLKLLPHRKNDMQTKIKESIHLIMGGTLGRLYMALKDRQDLDERKTLNDQMNASIIDDVHNRKVCSPSQGPCQNDAVGTVQQISQVIKLLDWESDNLSVVVVTHGIGGAGKMILIDAVYASLKEKFHGWLDLKFTAELNLVRFIPWNPSFLMKDLKPRR